MFAIQLVTVEQAMPKSLPFSGWISEHSTQMSGPADIANPTMKSSSMATLNICSPWLAMPRCIMLPTAPRPIAMTLNPT